MSFLGFLERLTGPFYSTTAATKPKPSTIAEVVSSSTLPPPPEAAITIDVNAARHEHAAAANAHALACGELARIEVERNEAAEALTAAERTYVASPNDPTPVRAAKERVDLVNIRHTAAVATEAEARSTLDEAKAALDSAIAATHRAEALERADLAAFRARQSSRSARMVALREELRTLAADSDEDFIATNEAAREAGIEPLDEIHLLADLFGPLPNIDTIKIMRHQVRVDMQARTVLTPLVQPFTLAAPRGTVVADQDRAHAHLEIIRQHRTFIAGLHAVEAELAAERKSEADRLARDPEEIARRAAFRAEQERLSRLPTTRGMFGPIPDPFEGYRAP